MGAVTGNPASFASWRERAAWFLILCLALILSRRLLAPRYLITFDEINFALAVEHFDPRLAQPQPPGDPLFVELLKGLSRVTPRMETAFLAAALATSIASLAMVWAITALAAGPRHGLIGALLLLFNPAFWLGALTNPVRLCLAAGSAGVAFCVWMACRGNASRWVPIAAAVLGLSAGARPVLAVLLAPLVLWAAWRTRAGWRTTGFAALCFTMAVCTWLPVLVRASGGWQSFLYMLTGYSGEQFGDSSLLFGASFAGALRMAWKAVVWSCLGVLSWIWAVPFARRKGPIGFTGFTGVFLSLWFFPGLLFYALVHVGDPDHTLAIVPATCVVGAVTLAAFTRQLSSAKRVSAIVFCVLLNVFLFFKPISKTAKASTYPPVRWMDGYVADVIDGVHTLPGRRPFTAIFEEQTTGWRQLSYYDRHVRILVVSRGADGAIQTRNILGSEVVTGSIRDGIVRLPGCGTLAWVDPNTAPVSSGETLTPWAHARMFSSPVKPGDEFEFRGMRFVAGETTCDGRP